ncbi:MAG: type II toxin-antitoxin system RelE/ParE family toxin [Syntrophales bacterium]
MNKYSILWTKTAEQDMSRIIDYIGRDSLDRALEIFHAIQTSATALNSLPERGRIVPELKVHGISTYRELVISPWRLIYRIEGKRVFILTIIDGRRNLEDILLERLLYSDK